MSKGKFDSRLMLSHKLNDPAFSAHMKTDVLRKPPSNVIAGSLANIDKYLPNVKPKLKESTIKKV